MSRVMNYLMINQAKGKQLVDKQQDVFDTYAEYEYQDKDKTAEAKAEAILNDTIEECF